MSKSRNQQDDPQQVTIDQLLERTMDGDQQAAAELLAMFRDRLLRMVELRMSPQLGNRVDAVDVVQESLFHISARLEEFAAGSLQRHEPTPPFLMPPAATRY